MLDNRNGRDINNSNALAVKYKGRPYYFILNYKVSKAGIRDKRFKSYIYNCLLFKGRCLYLYLYL